jgi:DNA uptake protein ComE-like DNA-binding protein
MSLLFVWLLGCAEEPVAPAAAPVTEPAPPPAPEPPPAEPAVVAAPRLDVNSATEEQLGALPGVGPKMVHEFEEYRPYKSILQFRKEIGKYVPPEEVARFETMLYVPIDPEKSDAPTIMQIQGLDQAEVEAIVAGRPYADRAAFMAALAAALTPEELAAARPMFAPAG